MNGFRYAPSVSRIHRSRSLFCVTRRPRRKFAAATATATATATEHVPPPSRWETDFEAWRTELRSADDALHKALFRPLDAAELKARGGTLPKQVIKHPSVFGSSALREKVISVIQNYNYLVSQLARAHHQQEDGVSKRITGTLLAKKPFPSQELSLLESTQDMLLKSHCIRFYALLKVQLSPKEGLEKGLDNRAFTTLRDQQQLWTNEALKKTRYGRSTKSAKVKKDLPKKARMTAETTQMLSRFSRDYNWKLMAQLWPRLSTHNLEKRNSVRTISCHWKKCPSFMRTRTYQKQEVAQLRDRVLAMIVEVAVHPITEYQADPHSFGWRHRGRRSASMACKYVASLLERDLSVSNKENPIRMIKIDVNESFDKISHESILNSYPLIVKYRPFLESFLKAPRRGHRIPPKEPLPRRKKNKEVLIETETTPEGWQPKSGVLFDSVLGRSLVNNALDGLEETLLHDLPLHQHGTHGEDIRVVRYGTSILILGMSRYEIFEEVYQRLRIFLQERNLCSFDGQNSSIFTFKPGTSVEYLGFRYLFTRPGGENGHSGRFSRGFWNSRNNKFVIPSRFQVIIDQYSMNRMNDASKRSLSRSHTPFPVENLIERSNRRLEKFASYFDVSPSTHMQLHDNYAYKTFSRFRKLLRRKFQSSPKLGTMIQNKFYWRNEDGKDLRIGYKGLKTLKLKDLDTGIRQSFAARAPTTSFLMSNVYLDPDCCEGAFIESTSAAYTPLWIEDAFATKFKLVKSVDGDNKDEKNKDAAAENEEDATTTTTTTMIIAEDPSDDKVPSDYSLLVGNKKSL